MFERVIMIDWSSRSTPGPARPCADSCWLAFGDAACEKRDRGEPEYFRTRAACEARVRDLAAACRGRVLVGVDAAIGYPRGRVPTGLPVGRALCAEIASLVRDEDDNRNTRREAAGTLNARVAASAGVGHGPFWGWMGKGLDDSVPARRPAGFAFEEFRVADLAARSVVVGTRPQSPWKLGGAGSVGSQSLLAMGMVHRLLADEPLRKRAVLWPFEVEGTRVLRRDAVVIAEVWPSLFERRGGTDGHAIRDARQVQLARDAVMDDPEWVRSALDEPLGHAAAREEGWILGVPAAGLARHGLERAQERGERTQGGEDRDER